MKILSYAVSVLVLASVFLFVHIGATVGPIQVGENMYQMQIRMANTEDNIEQKVCNTEESVNDIHDKVCSIAESTNDVLEKTCNIEESTNDVLDKVCNLEACEPEPITAAGTISTPGSKCLANNITGTITIAASGVKLNLNGYEISGGGTDNILLSGVDDVHITGGRIGGGASNGISISGCEGIRVDGVDFHSTAIGVNVDNTSARIFVEGCKFRDHSAEAVRLTDVSDSKVIHCEISDCLGGVNITSNGTKLVVSDCIFFGTGVSGRGVRANSSSFILVQRCVAMNFFEGILFSSVADGLVNQCIASRCSDKGIFLDNTTDSSIVSCIAYANDKGLKAGTTAVKTYNNLAYANTTANYDGIPLMNLIVASPTSATGYWANVS